MNHSNDNVRGGALGTFLAWISSLMVIFLVLEGGLRLVTIPMAHPVVTINESHAQFGWSKRPNESTSKSTSEYDITFTINSLGLRDDDDLTREKPAGKQRVLVLGDSFVLGYTVDRQDHFVDLLEEALVADGHQVQVLNGGTEGYSTDQELVWLREEGLTFQPDVVVACFYQNDVYWNGQNSYTGKPKPRFAAKGNAEKPEPMAAATSTEAGWLARNTAIFGFFHNLSTASKYGSELGFNKPPIQMAIDETVALKSPPATLGLENCWARTEACLRGLRDSCEKAGTKLALLAIPSREQVQSDSADSYLKAHGLTAEQFDPHQPTQRILEAAEREGIATIAPLAQLQEAAKDGTRVYFEKDWHLNPAGNRVVADSLYAGLTGPDFLGGGTKDTGRARLAYAGAGGGIPTWIWVVLGVWLILSTLYAASYRDESSALAYVKVGFLIGMVVTVVLGIDALAGLAGPQIGQYIAMGVVALILGFVLWKSWSKLGIIREVYGSFVRSGQWYMIPLVVAMLTIGSLLIVASSSPFVAPFIYTLF